MNIWGVFSTLGTQGVGAVKGLEAAQGTVKQQGIGEVQDAVTLSVDAVRSADAAADIRLDRVAAIRAAIADGSYDTADKLDIALDRLLDRLG
jgi:anti-sigma28 factor (negative regulator of flagellin synthesis)